MCGITGIVCADRRPASPALVRRMTDALAHRGPDGEGFFADGPVAFGHRRLSIIDLSTAGNQPMSTADGAYTLSYNGETYNFRELRAELEGLGRRFRSRTDSEVVLEAYAEWGPEAVERLNGMFAFALYDRARREVVLARDRYGIKPLYYAIRGGSLLFASEIKALLQHPGCRAELDADALLEYFTFQNFLGDRTLFRGIRILPAGCTLRIGLDAPGDASIRRYWDFEFQEPATPSGNADDYARELDRLFRQAVDRQLVSDVPVGSYLSGGMDTGAVAALASAQMPGMRTFTIGFDLSSASGLELGFDERTQAERISYLLGTEQYEMVLKAGDMERALPSVVRHMEEPRVGQSYPNFYAAKLAGSFGKVVLSGAGGDELFGGYPWRYFRAAQSSGFDDFIDRYFGFWQRLVPEGAVDSFFRPALPDGGVGRAREIFASVFEGVHGDVDTPEDYINLSLYFEAKTFLHGLLVVEDKLSMAHGLETRLPFLDNDLVDFAGRVPVSLKLGNLGETFRLDENEPGPKNQRYFDQTHDGKLILRNVMARYVPADVTTAKKQGFSAPDASWFRGESIKYVERVLLTRDAALFEYLDRGTVHELVSQHLSGAENRRLLIWSLLYFEQWIGEFLA
jgi:asparagine synthase (glutamine-hydrolysing)